MQEFTTVFLFMNDANGIFSEAIGRLGIGVLVIGVAIFLFFQARKQPKQIIYGIFALLFGVMWISLQGPIYWGDYQTYNRLKDVYDNQQYEIAEGIVKVLHTQPKTGHAQGDITTVDGVEFVVNYFIGTLGYRKTIAHGGTLKDGVYAKIYYYDDISEVPGRSGGRYGWGRTILRVDLKRS